MSIPCGYAKIGNICLTKFSINGEELRVNRLLRRLIVAGMLTYLDL